MRSTAGTEGRWGSGILARPLGILARLLAVVGLAGLIGAYLLLYVSPLFSRPETTYIYADASAESDAAGFSRLNSVDVVRVRTTFALSASLDRDCGVAAVGISPDGFPQLAGHRDPRVLIVKDGAGG